MCVRPTSTVVETRQQIVSCYAAQRLTAGQRQELAVQALARTQSISQLARGHQVSRKFVCRQTATAAAGLQQAFAPDQTADEAVLFYPPVTKGWLRQLVLGLVPI